jgi:hypothetical protein
MNTPWEFNPENQAAGPHSSDLGCLAMKSLKGDRTRETPRPSAKRVMRRSLWNADIAGINERVAALYGV